jgi:hypothetical protein
MFIEPVHAIGIVGSITLRLSGIVLLDSEKGMLLAGANRRSVARTVWLNFEIPLPLTDLEEALTRAIAPP